MDRGDLNTDAHRGTPCEDEGRGQGDVLQGNEGIQRPSKLSKAQERHGTGSPPSSWKDPTLVTP